MFLKTDFDDIHIYANMLRTLCFYYFVNIYHTEDHTRTTFRIRFSTLCTHVVDYVPATVVIVCSTMTHPQPPQAKTCTYLLVLSPKKPCNCSGLSMLEYTLCKASGAQVSY